MAAEAGKFKRRHYYIDHKFQGRYMLTFFIPMVIMLGFMLATLYFGAQAIVNTTTRILSRDVENSVTLALQDQASPSAEQYRRALSDVAGCVKEFWQSRELKREMLATLLWIFGAGLFIVIVQIVLMTVFFSHKVAGPVYRFERALHEWIEGRYTGAIRLRRGDELQNLAGLFNDAQAATRGRLYDLIHAPDDEKRRELASKLEL
jgi:nitrate/nitrite-specific signal transduction histidine kinase